MAPGGQAGAPETLGTISQSFRFDTPLPQSGDYRSANAVLR